MAMNSPAVPAASPAVPVAAASANAPASSPSEVGAGDFLLMLGQLLGAPVATTGAKPPATTLQTTDQDGEATDAAQDAAALTGVPMPFLAQVAAQPASAGERAVDLLPIAAKAADTSATRGELGLPTDLLNASGKDDAPAFTSNLSPQQTQALDGAQQLRSAAVADAATGRPVQHHVGSSAWADEVGTRMIMMTERGQHSASLRLSPEHLGPLEVRIAVRDDQASVWFGAAHADTRAAIEQALPRLRELFASQGLSLADAGVHHQAPREQGRTPLPLSSGGLDGGDDGVAVTSPMAIKLGLIDAYA